MYFRARPVVVEPLDDFSACFCRLSGQTHLLDAFLAELLIVTDEAVMAVSKEELIGRLGQIMGLPPEELEPRVTRALETLLSMQLIESCDAPG